MSEAIKLSPAERSEHTNRRRPAASRPGCRSLANPKLPSMPGMRDRREKPCGKARICLSACPLGERSERFRAYISLPSPPLPYRSLAFSLIRAFMSCGQKKRAGFLRLSPPLLADRLSLRELSPAHRLLCCLSSLRTCSGALAPQDIAGMRRD
jgi:hypothetical protein